MEERSMAQVRSGGILALGFVLAGSSVLPGKVLATLPPFWASSAGAAIALLPLLPLALAERRLQSRAGNPPTGWRDLAKSLPLFGLQAFFGMALYRILLLKALGLIGPGQVGMAASATPVVTALLAALVFRERIGKKKLCGIVLVALGNALVSYREPGAGSLGLLYALGAAASESVFNVAAKGRTSNLGPLQSSAVVTALAWAILAGLALARGETPAPGSLTASVLTALAYQGLVASALAYVLFYRGASGLPASSIGVLSGLIPLSGFALSAVFLGEGPGFLAVLGAGLALGGMIPCALPDRKLKRPGA